MIYLGNDHGGFDLKEQIKKWLENWGYEFNDLGNTVMDKEDDYPEFAFKVGKAVTNDEKKIAFPKPWNERSKGILACRSGGGIVIAANKIKGVRAVGAYKEVHAKHARLHNDANIIAVSGDYTQTTEVQKILKAFLETEFTGEERHVRRLEQIKEYENLNQPLTTHNP